MYESHFDNRRGNLAYTFRAWPNRCFSRRKRAEEEEGTMTKCIDCLQREAELTRKNEQIRPLREALEWTKKWLTDDHVAKNKFRLGALGSGDIDSAIRTIDAALARETDNKILLKRQMGDCGGN